MQYVDDLEPVPADTVRNHARSAGDDQLARSRNTTRAPDVRLVCGQFHRFENPARDSAGGTRVLLRDVLADGGKMTNRPV